MSEGAERREYQRLLRDLFAARRSGMRLELDRIRALLRVLGDPQRRFGVVHIGGTNGKGSTAAFTEAILAAGGARTARYSSPHLSRFAERFVIGGRELGEGELVDAGEAVIRARAAVGGDPPTFFELATAIALQAFAAAGVDVAVLEVGLGGRFDATNAVDAAVAGVTGVALDHQQYLGDTLEQIAAEKAGIFKPGQRVVIGAAGEPEAVPWLVAAAERAGAAAIEVIDDAAVDAVTGPLGIPGACQRINAAAAVALARAAAAAGLARADDAAIGAGLAAARLPGRLETLAERPRVIADGAHNPHAARALAAELGDLARDRLLLVVGMSADKEIDAVMAALAAARPDAVIATRSRSERAASVDDLMAAAARTGAAEVIGVDGVAAALAVARERAGERDLVVVTGSLFAVGEAREAMLGEPHDDLDLGDPVGKFAGR